MMFVLDTNVISETRKASRHKGVMAWIAATALVTDMTVVTVATRNVKDFSDLGVRIFNPWAFGQAAAESVLPNQLPKEDTPPGGCG